MKTALMVAEKPSLAQSLAKLISHNNLNSRKGFNGACTVHEFVAKFPPTSEKMKFKFTSVCGHVMGLDFTGKYNNWDKVDPSELFHAQTLKKETNPNLKMPAFLEKEGRGCDVLVLWLDCDKEGENICFEVIDAVEQVMNKSSYNSKSIYRAKFSAITESEVMKAFSTLGSPNKNEALSVDARQEFDLRIGCAFTRFQTKFFQSKYGDLDSNLISYGPCQTPTLAFCVRRHDAINSFKPEPFWVIAVEVAIGGKTLSLEWERERVFDRPVAQIFLSLVKKNEFAKLVDIQKKEKSKARPLALNTVEMLRTGSSGLGLGPQQTMSLAERLYIKGYISYPRTETNSYPDSFDIKGVLQEQQDSRDWGVEVKALLMGGFQKPKKGHDAGDHPPITPMRLATQAELVHDEWRLYDYITRHFIATVSKDCTYLLTTLTFNVGSEVFYHSGKTLLDPGFTTIMPWQALSSDEVLPASCKVNQQYSVQQARMLEKHTSPPDYLTESELITLMEKHGIGTDASIPVHINNISERNYVSVTAGRKLKPTNLGIVLIHGYMKIDDELIQPNMRAALEEQFSLISQGKADYKDVVGHGVDTFLSKYLFFVQNINYMDELFEVSFTSLASTGKPLSRCGKCRRYMKHVQTKPCRLHCASCDETFSVPQNSNIRIYKELKCPLDDYELLYCTTGTKGMGYVFCPFCYNNPPFPGMKKGMGCNECLHPTCAHSLSKTSISECPQCSDGCLVLDMNSHPKWKINCNKCNLLISLCDHAQKLSVTSEDCPSCSSALVEVHYKEKCPFKNDKTQHTGCIFCDDLMTPLVKMNTAQPFKAPRRGRGGRGRGRGRGKPPPRDKMSQLAAYFV